MLFERKQRLVAQRAALSARLEALDGRGGAPAAGRAAPAPAGGGRRFDIGDGSISRRLLGRLAAAGCGGEGEAGAVAGFICGDWTAEEVVEALCINTACERAIILSHSVVSGDGRLASPGAGRARCFCLGCGGWSLAASLYQATQKPTKRTAGQPGSDH